jgi:hypothetical protein
MLRRTQRACCALANISGDKRPVARHIQSWFTYSLPDEMRIFRQTDFLKMTDAMQTQTVPA